MLKAELDNIFHARELLEQLQDSHRRTREAISSEILDRGKDAKEIFDRIEKQIRQLQRRLDELEERHKEMLERFPDKLKKAKSREQEKNEEQKV